METAKEFLLASPQFSPPPALVGSTSGLSVPSTPASITPGEVDPHGMAANQPGAKMDLGKVDVLRGAINYFPKALNAVARISEKGAKKYSWKGWMEVKDGVLRYGAALMRHLMKEEEEVIDPELDELHAAAVAWNALARLELIIRAREAKAVK